MKMFRLLSGMVAVAVLGLAGCGAQSPDFTPTLIGITVTPSSSSSPTVAAGDTISFTAQCTYSVPPGVQQTAPGACNPGDVSWSASPSNIGTIDNNGLFTAGPGTGTSTVTASGGDATPVQVVVTVTRPRLVSVSIVDGVTQGAPKTTLTVGSSSKYQVLGKYSDSPTVRPVDGDSTIAWSSDNTAVADPNPKTQAITTLTPSATGSLNLTVLVTPVTGSAQTASLPITVSNQTPQNLAAAVKLNPPTVTAPGAGTPTSATQSQATAVAMFADGSSQDVANDGNSVTWSSGTVGVATIDATSGLATSVAPGQTTITATPKPGVFSGTQNTASAVLTVTDPVCPSPLLATGGATVSDATSGICLLCGATNDGNVIDGDFNNFATLSTPVSLLTGAISLTVKAPASITPAANQQAGFIIGRPAGSLVLAEVMSQVTITTSLNNVTADTTSTSTPLRVDLLGTSVTGTQSGLISMPVSKPFDSITVTFSGGLASALSSLQVFGACAAAVPPQ